MKISHQAYAISTQWGREAPNHPVGEKEVQNDTCVEIHPKGVQKYTYCNIAD